MLVFVPECRTRRVFYTKVIHNYQSSCTADIFLFALAGEKFYLSLIEFWAEP